MKIAKQINQNFKFYTAEYQPQAEYGIYDYEFDFDTNHSKLAKRLGKFKNNILTHESFGDFLSHQHGWAGYDARYLHHLDCLMSEVCKKQVASVITGKSSGEFDIFDEKGLLNFINDEVLDWAYSIEKKF